jgi:hypothetical protein
MNKRIFSAMILAAALCLTGCQLAKDEPAPQDDALAGVLVTDEYLDLFDFDSYFEDNADRLVRGDSVISQEESEKYSAVIWAEAAPDGEFYEYTFPGADGISMFCHTRTDEDGTQYRSTENGEGISVVKMHFIDTDEETAVEMEGTIYVAPAVRGMSTFYINPVYQTPDGRLYVTTGNGISSDGDTEGGSFSHEIEEKHTVTENGESRQHRTKVNVTIQYMKAPKSVSLIEMDSENNVVACTEYAPDDVPVSLETAAEYIIVETRYSDDSAARELFGRDCTYLSTFRCRDDGICIEASTEIIWQD